MNTRILIFFLIASELFIEVYFSQFKQTYHNEYHILVFTLLLLIGRLHHVAFFQRVFKSFAPKTTSNQNHHHESSPSSSEHQEFLLNGVFSVLVTKLMYYVIRKSLGIVTDLVDKSFHFSGGVLQFIISFFDVAPLWLLIAGSDTLIPAIAEGTGLYMKAFIWFLIWLVGGYVFVAFAVISAATGVIFKGPIK
jgi:hypothetical protein